MLVRRACIEGGSAGLRVRRAWMDVSGGGMRHRLASWKEMAAAWERLTACVRKDGISFFSFDTQRCEENYCRA